MAANKAGGRGGVVGPAGRRAAANLRQLRDDRNLSTAQLAAILHELGQPIQATGITKTEAGTRRIDVDDLVALAIALDVAPNRLLLPAEADDTEIELTPGVRARAENAWEWATGHHPLIRLGLPPEAYEIRLPAAEERLNAFIRENRPNEPYSVHYFDKRELHKHPELIRQAALLVRAARQEGVSPSLVRDFIDLALMTAVNGETEQPPSTAAAELAVVAAIVTSDRGVLVARRNDGEPPWTFIAGENRLDESPEDTIIREVKEEATLRIRAGEVIGERDHPRTGRHMIYLAAKPARGTDIYVGDEAELAEVRWVSLAEAEDLMPDMFGPVRDYLARTLGGGR